MGKERIEWLAVLRGLNIVLVAMFHVQLVDMTTGQNHAFCTLVSQPFSPFRMPLFIFCSGGLLYLSRIRKEWPVGELYIDKVKRIVVPFVFFVTFYYFFKLSLNSFVKTILYLLRPSVGPSVVSGRAVVDDADVPAVPMALPFGDGHDGVSPVDDGGLFCGFRCSGRV